MSTPASLNACAAFYAAQHGQASDPSAAGRIRAVHRATAADLCSHDVPTCDPGMLVSEAARLMRSRHVGALVVIEKRPEYPQVVAGIVTHRDIATAIAADGEHVTSLRVGDVMTRDVVNARAGDPVHNVLSVMHRERIRRMPVTGPEDELVGMVTIEDVVAAMGAQVQALTEAVAAIRRQQE